jgi:hypothetical protein
LGKKKDIAFEFLKMNPNELSEEEQPEIPIKFLKKISKMIEKGATGFELAYETEINSLQGRLMNDGIFFYKTFINIGKQKFIDVPDRKKTSYQPFKLVEPTEKHLFIKWLEKKIAEKEKKKNLMDEYAKYVDSREYKYKEILICEKCGAQTTDRNQKICEECGAKLG